MYQRFYPAFELWKAGAIVAGGSDYPVDPLLPMVQIETAVDHTGEAIPGVYPGALSPREASPTCSPRSRCTRSTRPTRCTWSASGSIEVGKYADLIVLSQNLFDVPTERISDTAILQTILVGQGRVRRCGKSQDTLGSLSTVTGAGGTATGLEPVRLPGGDTGRGGKPGASVRRRDGSSDLQPIALIARGRKTVPWCGLVAALQQVDTGRPPP